MHNFSFKPKPLASIPLLAREETFSNTRDAIEDLYQQLQDIDVLEDATIHRDNFKQLWVLSQKYWQEIFKDKTLDDQTKFTLVYKDFHRLWEFHQTLRSKQPQNSLHEYLSHLSRSMMNTWQQTAERWLSEDKARKVEWLAAIINDPHNNFFQKRCAVEYLYIFIAPRASCTDINIRRQCDQLVKDFTFDILRQRFDSPIDEDKKSACFEIRDILKEGYYYINFGETWPPCQRRNDHTWRIDPNEIPEDVVKKYQEARTREYCFEDLFLINRAFKAYADAPSEENARTFIDAVNSAAPYIKDPHFISVILEPMQSFILYHRHESRIPKPAIFKSLVVDFYNACNQYANQLYSTIAFDELYNNFRSLLLREKNSRPAMSPFELAKFQHMVSQLPNDDWKTVCLERESFERPLCSTACYQYTYFGEFDHSLRLRRAILLFTTGEQPFREATLTNLCKQLQNTRALDNPTTYSNNLQQLWILSQEFWQSLSSVKASDNNAKSSLFTAIFLDFHRLYEFLTTLDTSTRIKTVSNLLHRQIIDLLARMKKEWEKIANTWLTKNKEIKIDWLAMLINDPRNNFFVRRCAVEYLYSFIASPTCKDMNIRRQCDQLAKDFTLRTIRRFFDSLYLEERYFACRNMSHIMEDGFTVFYDIPYPPSQCVYHNHTWRVGPDEIPKDLRERYTASLQLESEEKLATENTVRQQPSSSATPVPASYQQTTRSEGEQKSVGYGTFSSEQQYRTAKGPLHGRSKPASERSSLVTGELSSTTQPRFQ